ncbi:hypothetical protein P278_27630 [Zhouia amylolytica AD3]|uniref:Uncharacterized protein n=1 Tax=Zhouia amylolytica AD3 TaxID=1286632 RepID=W2UL00_9FLAO|nr:hypothetical protein P278_27630 [Zhouia amylolytica AD3]
MVEAVLQARMFMEFSLDILKGYLPDYIKKAPNSGLFLIDYFMVKSDSII